MSFPQFIESFSSLGRTFPPSDRLISQISRFVHVCLLYGVEVSSNVNACRNNLFKLGKCSDDLLPPTYDGLFKHIERANFRSAVWSNCLLPNPVIPSPIGNGWKLCKGEHEVAASFHSRLTAWLCPLYVKQDAKHSVALARKPT